MAARCLPGLVLLPFLVLGAGCGRTNPNTPANVSGTVTNNGTVVKGGTVMFHSDAGVYSAAIQSDGTYTVVDLPAGDMVVTVDTEALNPNRKQPAYTGGAGPGPVGGGGRGKGKAEIGPIPEGAPREDPANYVKISRIYATKATSPLKVTVTKGDQKHNLELTDQK